MDWLPSHQPARCVEFELKPFTGHFPKRVWPSDLSFGIPCRRSVCPEIYLPTAYTRDRPWADVQSTSLDPCFSSHAVSGWPSHPLTPSSPSPEYLQVSHPPSPKQSHPQPSPDIFVKQVRGSKMSMFGVAVVVAPAVAPVFCGLIVSHTSWRVLFWLILGMAGLQLVMFFFLVPEPSGIHLPAVGSADSGDNLEYETKAVEDRIESSISNRGLGKSPVRSAPARAAGQSYTGSLTVQSPHAQMDRGLGERERRGREEKSIQARMQRQLRPRALPLLPKQTTYMQPTRLNTSSLRAFNWMRLQAFTWTCG